MSSSRPISSIKPKASDAAISVRMQFRRSSFRSTGCHNDLPILPPLSHDMVIFARTSAIFGDEDQPHERPEEHPKVTSQSFRPELVRKTLWGEDAGWNALSEACTEGEVAVPAAWWSRRCSDGQEERRLQAWPLHEGDNGAAPTSDRAHKGAGGVGKGEGDFRIARPTVFSATANTTVALTPPQWVEQD